MYIFVTYSTIFTIILAIHEKFVPQKPCYATHSFMYTTQIWTWAEIVRKWLFRIDWALIYVAIILIFDFEQITSSRGYAANFPFWHPCVVVGTPGWVKIIFWRRIRVPRRFLPIWVKTKVLKCISNRTRTIKRIFFMYFYFLSPREGSKKFFSPIII